MIILPKTLKMVVTDFDGIITDNCVYINEAGQMSRKLKFKDIMAFSLLKKNGFQTAIISGEANSAIDIVAKKFDIIEVHQNIRNKYDVLQTIINKYSLTEKEYVYIGDDVNDYDSLVHSLYAITVPNAVEKIKSIENIQITTCYGGNGAFREVVDSLID